MEKRKRRSKRVYDKKLLLHVTDSMLIRLDALGLQNRSEAIRRCVFLGMELIESEMRQKPEG